jgi:hypothetical protein
MRSNPSCQHFSNQSNQLSSLAPIMVARGGKADILTTAVVAQAPPPQAQKSKWRVLGFVAVLAGVVVIIAVASHYGDLPLPFLSAIRWRHHGVGGGEEGLCPQSDVLYPARHAQLWRRLGRDFDDDAFTARAVSWLGGAVRVRCVFRLMVRCWSCGGCGADTCFAFPLLSEVRSRTTTWAPLASISGGKLSDRSTTTWPRRSPLRM